VIAVTITVDTEADHRGDAWVKSDPLAFRSVTDGVPKRLEPLLRSHGARATYLLTTEVMADPRSVEVLGRLTEAELGTHLHGDHVPPLARVPEPAGSTSWDFTCFYPHDVERAKLQTITRQYHEQFGKPPRSYRAGRYAASGYTAQALVELGYVVDTSVTPALRWVNELDPSQVLDFVAAPLEPYRPSAANLAQPGPLRIWELPITIVPRPGWWNVGLTAAQVLAHRPQVTYPVWLRPSTTSWPWLRWIVGTRLAGAPGRSRLFNIMFHSMEVVEGASPYTPTRASAERVLRRLDRLLGFLRHVGARFVTASELAGLLDGGAWERPAHA